MNFEVFTESDIQFRVKDELKINGTGRIKVREEESCLTRQDISIFFEFISYLKIIVFS